ncbi:glycosyltransferase family 2 protein [Cellulosimicrobium cellulans]|uniref:glycosyltransferase family 2 protein n=1 Tax=Cellulosimicrobium cellulans TaxID=1710 RepID=UPI00130EA4DC|nr:glycosyltransferase [Cellulosimicrobium cellulans]
MTGPARPGRPLPGNRWDLLDGVLPADPPSVSVVVVHYDQQAELDRTLRALARQDHPADRTEVLVVDDGSPVPPRVPDGVRLLRQEDRGFRVAAARNVGAAAATHDVLVFLDADTAPEPGYLRAISRLPALAPDCVAVGRRRHADLAGAPVDAPVEQLGPERELPEPAWLVDAYRRSRDLLDADDRSYRYVIGAVTACSRALFEEAGGFDEGFSSYGGEDWEWAYRAWLAGAVLAHVPDAVAWHDGPDWSGRDAASRAAKNTEALRLADLVPVPGSRPRGLPSGRADVLVHAPGGDGVSAAQRFVSVDSVLAALPGAVAAPGAAPGSGPVTDPGTLTAPGAPTDPHDPATGDPRFDRVRLDVLLDRPLRADPGTGSVAAAVERVAAEGLAELALLGADGAPLLRVVSRRARARERRWRRDDLFPRATAPADGLTPLPDEPDLEAYLGGW